MDKANIINLLKNSGIKVFGMDDSNIYFEDPSCIFPAFDTILHFAWIFITGLTIFMLVGWAFLYIKNGVKINTLFNNAKTLILIFGILSIVKPIVNTVYGDDLFARQCDTKQVSLASINELLAMRDKNFSKWDNGLLYESFEVIDSGAKYSIEEDDDNEEDE